MNILNSIPTSYAGVILCFHYDSKSVKVNISAEGFIQTEALK